MKIGYFTHTNVAVSETFIYDLLLTLHNKADRFTFFSGASAGKPIGEIDAIYTGYYAHAEKGGYLLYKAGQLLGGKGDHLKFSHFQRNARQMLKPFRQTLAQLDAAFIDYGTSSALLYPILQAHKIPYVIRVLGYDVTSAFASKAYKKAFLSSCEAAYAVIAISHHLKRLLVLAGVDPKKIHVVRLGADGDRITPGDWASRVEQAPSVVHLGRLTPKKHPVALVQAFAVAKSMVPDARLTIIGDGPLMPAVKARVQDLGLSDCVFFTGALGREYAIPILKRHWIFAQHSVTSITGDQEGFALSPAEAALCELPVVATAHSGITEQVIDFETGFLVQEHDYETMGKRIAWLLQHPDEAERMGKAGRRQIMSICDPGVQVDKIYSLLAAACSKAMHPEAG